ncbi:hypothetical protein ACFSTI_22295 [Rhizorhabdus histidinilytica]
MSRYHVDRLILRPDDIDPARSPLAGHLDAETYILGAFNPGLTRLPNGNLLAMVRIAEALRDPIRDGKVHAIRWEADDLPAGKVAPRGGGATGSTPGRSISSTRRTPANSCYAAAAGESWR